MFKKATALFLAILMATLALVGCTPASVGGTDGTTDGTTAPEETTGPYIPVEIPVEKLASYKVVRYEYASNETIALAQKVRNAIGDTLGTKPGLMADTLGKNEEVPATACEILIGYTNRLESTKYQEMMRELDYGVAFENDRIIITGGSDGVLEKAVDFFIEKYVVAGASSIVLNSAAPDVRESRPYMFKALSINGVDIKNYKIVYPKDSDRITYFTAVALADYVNSNLGYKLEVVDDSKEESEYEFLVGVTNRTVSTEAAKISLGDDKYILWQTGNKIVMQGASYYVGAAAGEFVNKYANASGNNVTLDVTGLPTTAKAATFTFPKATSAILMIGDGMGQSHIDMTIKTQKIDEFVAARLPVVTTCKTYSQSVINGVATYTDSAASATALATGYKTLNGYLGMIPVDELTNQSVQNVRELAHSKGYNTAVVTTDVITGATPSGFLCHLDNRNDSAVLQEQIDALVAENAVDYVWGATSSSLRRQLVPKTREALGQISANNENFFIMIEEAYIDKNSHNNDHESTMNCVERYNECIAYCIAFTMLHPTTALIITADHECGGITADGDNYIYTSNNHTNTNVPLFALGGGVKEWVDSTYALENIDVAKHIASIFGATEFGQSGFIPMP